MKRRSFLTMLGIMPVIVALPAFAFSEPKHPLSDGVKEGAGVQPVFPNDRSFVVMGNVYRRNTCISTKNSKFTICHAMDGVERHQ